MYEALKSSIAQLETEIVREREMEESQRYFFSAASHELKTPIAAMSALVEEMLEGMVDAEGYPDSLRKCMKMIYHGGYRNGVRRSAAGGYVQGRLRGRD